MKFKPKEYEHIFTQRWVSHFIGMAQYVSTQSKDPSTKCGAVIVRPDRTVLSMGFNGFPRGMRDDPALYEERTEKYERIIHAEMNALLTAESSARDCVLFTWPFMPCPRCAVHIIQAGIRSVYAPPLPPDRQDWADRINLSTQLFAEAYLGIHNVVESAGRP